MIGSRMRKLCMNSVSKPTMWQASPTHSRWLCRRSISSMMVRMYSARGGGRSAAARLDGLRVGHVVHAAADAADALGQHRDVVVAEHGLGQFLDAAMHHEPAILAAAHHLALDVEAEMRRLVQRGMERAEGHDRAAFRRLVERELALVVEVLGHLVPRRHPCAADARRRASRRAAPGASGSGGPPARCRPGRAFRARPSWPPGTTSEMLSILRVVRAAGR